MFRNFAHYVSSHPLVIVIIGSILVACLLWGGLYLLLRCLLVYRRFTHAERLKMIEAGQSADVLRMLQQQAKGRRFIAVALALALWIPAIALIGATCTAMTSEGNFATALVAWCSAAVASLGSTICATLVMWRQRAEDASLNAGGTQNGTSPPSS
jgi:hypothetical protein